MDMCSTEGCGGIVLARGLCNKHYQRWLVGVKSTYQKTCSVDGCTGVVVSRGLCNKHYQRWKRYDDPLVVLKEQADHGAPQDFIETALKHPDKESCLHWPFARNHDGYAIHDVGTTKSQYVQRRICETINGPPPSAEHEAAHSCGKGHLGCVNPHHLKWKTRVGNEADKIIHGTVKLTWEKVREIRAMQGKMSTRKVAAIFSVSNTVIHNIWHNIAWKEGEGANE